MIPDNSNKNGAARSFFSKLNKMVTFQVALLVAPVCYCFHQLEEIHTGFRPWRLRHFMNNNPLPTESIFAILTAITLAFVIYYTIRKNKISAQLAIFPFMTMQLHDGLAHIGAGMYFMDYSPGTITSILLYLPVNILICMKAIQEGWMTRLWVLVMFILSGIVFWSFETVGPFLIAIVVILMIVYAIAFEMKAKKPSSNIRQQNVDAA